MRTPRLPAVDWTDAFPPPGRFKLTRPFRRKTKSAFCACAITFQTHYTNCLLCHCTRKVTFLCTRCHSVTRTHHVNERCIFIPCLMIPELRGTLYMLCYRDLPYCQWPLEKSHQMYVPAEILNSQSSLSCNTDVNFTTLFAFSFMWQLLCADRQLTKERQAGMFISASSYVFVSEWRFNPRRWA